MAGVSTKEIKNRIRSMESTRQITKAMEMVAASKLRKAQSRVIEARPYFQTLHKAICDIAAASKEEESLYLRQRSGGKTLLVVIGGDRGLAGGYNSNVLKLAMEQKADAVLPVGKKALEFFRLREVEIFSPDFAQAEKITVSQCFSLAKKLCKAYREGQFNSISVCYTDFVSVLTQTPKLLQLLPLTGVEGGKAGQLMYEPDAQTVLEAIVPEYLGGVLYGALCESRASEQAARRTAMDAATSNADEMIADLSLRFNRARQAAITQEITEIVAGGQ